MFIKVKSKLTQNQKANIKYFLAIWKLKHLLSLFTQERFLLSTKDLYLRLQPTLTNLKLMRVGGWLDGSYLVPKLEIEYDGVVSPGVGETFNFESEIVDSRRKVVLIDGTVAKPINLPTNFEFLPKMLGSKSSSGGNFISLEAITSQYFSKSNALVLQMDIEGAEYEVLGSVDVSDLSQYALILVEFHHLHRLRENSSWNHDIDRALKVLETDFLLVHTHPNNAGGFYLWKFKKLPKVVETTWINKRYVSKKIGLATLPHPLDIRNDHMMKDLQFPQMH